MLWISSLRHLLHTVGWTGNSRMTDITWKYAIIQAFKLSNVQYLPGHYNGRLSYTTIYLVLHDDVQSSSSRNVNHASRKIIPLSEDDGILSPDALGFQLPFARFNLAAVVPPVIANVFQQFLSQTKPKHHSQSIDQLKSLQSLARSVFDQLNLSDAWDAVVVVTALTLSHRKPLPMTNSRLRDCEWVDLVTRRRSPDGESNITPYGNSSDFCLSFIVTGIARRYSKFNQGPYPKLVASWERRWGTFP